MLSSNKKLLQEVFRTEILRHLDFIEGERKAELRVLFKQEGLFALGLVFIVFVVAYCACLQSYAVAIFFIAVVLGVIAFMIYLPIEADKNFRERLKKQFFPVFLKKFHKMKWGIDAYNIKTDILHKSGLFAEFQRERDDDTFIGNYNGVDFNITETQLFDLKENWLSKHHDTYELKVFQGVIISFDSPKVNKTPALVTTKLDFNTKNNVNFNITFLGFMLIMLMVFLPLVVQPEFNLLDLTLCLLHPVSLFIIGYLVYYFWKKINKGNKWRKKKIKLEDPRWEKQFVVYSDDEVEARYLITTSFMERFLNLNTAFGTRRAKCCFYDDKVLFAISTDKNLFELGSLFTPLTTTNSWVNFINELSSILDMIDYFKLNEKIGL